MTSKAAASLPIYLTIQACMGIAMGLAFGFVLLATDTAELGSLVLNQDLLALLVYCAGSAVAVCPVVVTTAVGLLAWDRPS
jgi:hypothetical protein